MNNNSNVGMHDVKLHYTLMSNLPQSQDMDVCDLGRYW